jgi:hypothetical protein
MPDPTRFEREIDIDEPAEGPIVSRFDRLDRESELVDQVILSGSTLIARAEEGRISISLQPKGPTGKYPSFEVGLMTLGEHLEGAPLEGVEGEAPGVDLVDQELLKGVTLVIVGLGSRLMASWSRVLPERTFLHKGVSHRVYRTGVRTTTGVAAIRSIGVAREALRAKENVSEGSIMDHSK